jgi:hypothetical protein
VLVGKRIESRLPSPERREQFLQLLRAGNYVETACDYTGISKSAVYAWMGEAKGADARPVVTDFVDAIKEARGFAQASNVQIVMRAAHSGHWQAAAWWLERTNPKQWGRIQRHEVEAAPATPVDVKQQLLAAMAVLGAELRQDGFIEVEVSAPEPLPAVRPLRSVPETGS